MIRQAINDDTSVAIDTVLLDSGAATTVRPAGLLNGLTTNTPSAATATFDRMIADIKGLIAPIVAARGGRDLVLLMNTAQSLSLSWGDDAARRVPCSPTSPTARCATSP